MEKAEDHMKLVNYMFGKLSKKYTMDRDELRSILNLTLVKCCNNFVDDGRAKFASYFCKAAWMNVQREVMQPPGMSVDTIALTHDPWVNAEIADYESLHKAVSLLDARERMVITELYFNEKKYREIGKMLGWKHHGSVWAVEHRALKKLKKALGKFEL